MTLSLYKLFLYLLIYSSKLENKIISTIAFQELLWDVQKNCIF